MSKMDYAIMLLKLENIKRTNSLGVFFEKAVYSYLLALSLILLPLSRFIWGDNSFVYHHPSGEGALFEVLYFLNSGRSIGWFWLVFLIQALSFIFIWKNKYKLESKIVFVVCSFVIQNSAYLAFNAGNRLFLLFALYLVFFNVKKNNESNLISFFAIKACQIQLVILYAATAIYKITGSSWVNGDSLQMVMSNSEYSFIPFDLEPFSPILKVLTWIVLLHQITFPILIWFKKTRSSVVWLGVAIHLCIGIFIGLYDFAIAMIVSYTVFGTYFFNIKLLLSKRIKDKNSFSR